MPTGILHWETGRHTVSCAAWVVMDACANQLNAMQRDSAVLMPSW